jgi:uncharacterized protein with ATP-grasp and redox domains
MTCFMAQAVKAAKLSTEDPRQRIDAIKKAARDIANLDRTKTPPEIATDIFKTIARVTGNPDAFKELKQKSNVRVKELMASAEKYIKESGRPLSTAVNISLCGNIIDYGILDDFDVSEVMEKEINADMDARKIEKLKNIITGSNIISFLADNAGEIGFDGLLLREFRKINPNLNITVIVKSVPIINDATMEDAEFFGLDKEFKILACTSSVGVNIKFAPPELRRVLDRSDYIISKGQANYEIISDSGMKNVVYLLRTKCSVVARNIGVEKGCPVLII